MAGPCPRIRSNTLPPDCGDASVTFACAASTVRRRRRSTGAAVELLHTQTEQVQEQAIRFFRLGAVALDVRGDTEAVQNGKNERRERVDVDLLRAVVSQGVVDTLPDQAALLREQCRRAPAELRIVARGAPHLDVQSDVGGRAR